MGSLRLGGGLQGRHTCATPRVRGMVSEQGISWDHSVVAAAFKTAILARCRGFEAWFQNTRFHGITVPWRRPSRPPHLRDAAGSGHGFRTRDFMGPQCRSGGLQGRHTCAVPRVRSLVSEHGISWVHSVVAAAFKAAKLARRRGCGAWFQNTGFHGFTVPWRQPSRPPHLRGSAGSCRGFITRDFMGSQCRSGGLQGRHTCAMPRIQGMVSEQGISWDHGAVAAAFKAATLARCRGFRGMVSEHGISQLRTLRAARSFNVFLPPCPLPAVASNQCYLW